MIGIIADHYGVPLVNEAVAVPDNNSTLAIQMVIDGTVDFAGPNFSPGMPLYLYYQSMSTS